MAKKYNTKPQEFLVSLRVITEPGALGAEGKLITEEGMRKIIKDALDSVREDDVCEFVKVRAVRVSDVIEIQAK